MALGLQHVWDEDSNLEHMNPCSETDVSFLQNMFHYRCLESRLHEALLMISGGMSQDPRNRVSSVPLAATSDDACKLGEVRHGRKASNLGE